MTKEKYKIPEHYKRDWDQDFENKVEDEFKVICDLIEDKGWYKK